MNAVAGEQAQAGQPSVELLAFLAEVSQQLAVSVDLTRTLRESSAYVALYLDAEAVTDEGVERMPVDPHLLSHRQTDTADEFDERRLDPGVG